MNPTRWALRTLGRRLPVVDGRRAIDGIDGEITIRRDRFGIPHVRTESAADAWFGVGFCHGQDRTFQMELRLRLVRGTLAALVGAEAATIDELSRRIGFRRHGERLLDELPPDHRMSALAYAAGARAGATIGLRRAPHEFVLLRSRPEPYEAADALGFLAVQAFALASNWDTELARLAIVAADGPEAAAAVDPAYPAHLPASLAPGIGAGAEVAVLADAVAEDLRRLAEASGWLGGGSNNWALSGSRTTTGRPLLANDPHLAPVLPAHWYLVDVACPEWRVVGASLPGTPAFGAGHNGHAAWGITAALTDTTDLFLEEVGPDGTTVRRGDRFAACETRRETIEVRDGDDIEVLCVETDRGPLIGPALEASTTALSMAATWLRPGSLGGFFEIPTIRSVDRLHTAFARWPGVPLNVAFADADGSIAWKLIGDLPVRRSGSGAVPMRAADPDVGWEDELIPTSSLPHLRDPESGVVVTANNLPAAGALHLGVDFIDGYRAARIAEALAEKPEWDIPSTLALQVDRTSIPARQIREQLVAAMAEAGDLGLLADALRSWDGVLGPDSVGATVFEAVTAELVRAVVAAKAPRSVEAATGRGFTPLVPFTMFMVRRTGHLADLLDRRPEGWFSDGWDEAIRTAARAARARLVEHAGPDPRSWAWGDVRPLTLKHPMSLRPPLGRVFDLGPIPHGGDGNTVNPAPVDPLDPFANPDFAVASLRMVVDVGDWSRARFVLPGGQSGNPFSRHYGDQLPLWQRGDALVIAWEEDDITRTARSSLTLSPA
ncbi:MAG TPA: penicillin acylase family protein [Acidimicrobiia bacterium]|nr:penicillin acylase family protein [Acidimicrobiia bacterium]